MGVSFGEGIGGVSSIILINRLGGGVKISLFFMLSMFMFILSGLVANTALDGAIRIALQCIFLSNVFAYLYGMTMYGPHLYMRFSGDSGSDRIGRFLFMLVCVFLGMVCVIY